MFTSPIIDSRIKTPDPRCFKLNLKLGHLNITHHLSNVMIAEGAKDEVTCRGYSKRRCSYPWHLLGICVHGGGIQRVATSKDNLAIFMQTITMVFSLKWRLIVDGVKINEQLDKDLFIYLQLLLDTISVYPPILSNVEKPCLTLDWRTWYIYIWRIVKYWRKCI